MSHFPVAVRKLRLLFALHVIKIEMAKAGAFARPEKTLAILEEMEIVAEIDPVLVLLGEQQLGFARECVGEEEIQGVLEAIEALDGQMMAIG